MAFCAACDESVDGGGASSESTVCTTVGTASWWNQSITDQAGQFHVEFSATPSAANIDGVVGLSSGAATKWASLAAIVRFNPQGTIDARNGSTYAATQRIPYGPYAVWIRMDIDVAHHTYSVWASNQQGSYGSWNQIANNYAFRTEQASVTHLNNISGFVNPDTGPGTLQVCNLAVNVDSPTGDGCVASAAGAGFVNVAVGTSTNAMIVDASAIPSMANMDGVVGVASGTVDGYNDLAVAIRFYTNGVIEARDGDTYRADVAVPYAPAQPFSVKFVIDLANHRYSAFVYPQYGDQGYEIAKNYRFRTQQQAVASLDHVATIVASSSGRLQVCNALNVGETKLRFAHDGAPAFAPAADGGVIVSDGATTQRLDANGKVIASASVGGVPAVDSHYNVYLARAFNNTITVDAYTPTFSRLWTRSFASSTTPYALAVAGERLLVAAKGGVSTEVYALMLADGSGALAYYSQGIVGLSSAGWVVAEGDRTNGHNVLSYTADGSYQWGRSYPAGGSYDIYAIAEDPNGTIVFGGEYYAQVDFGTGAIYPVESSEEGSFNALIVQLSATGDVRAAYNPGGNRVIDLAAAGGQLAAAVYHYTQFPWVYVHGGNWSKQGFGLGENGYADKVGLSLDGSRVFANIRPVIYWSPARDAWPFFVSADR